MSGINEGDRAELKSGEHEKKSIVISHEQSYQVWSVGIYSLLPIPFLELELPSWDNRRGPFVVQSTGENINTRFFWQHYIWGHAKKQSLLSV